MNSRLLFRKQRPTFSENRCYSFVLPFLCLRETNPMVSDKHTHLPIRKTTAYQPGKPQVVPPTISGNLPLPFRITRTCQCVKPGPTNRCNRYLPTRKTSARKRLCHSAFVPVYIYYYFVYYTLRIYKRRFGAVLFLRSFFSFFSFLLFKVTAPPFFPSMRILPLYGRSGRGLPNW